MPFNEFKRVVILGGNGMMGRYAVKYFTQKGYTVVSTTRATHNFDTTTDKVNELLETLVYAGDVVVNCIGMTNKRPSSLPEDELAFYRINVALPRLVALRCVMIGAWFVHITTDCVYTGNRDVHGEGYAWFPRTLTRSVSGRTSRGSTSVSGTSDGIVQDPTDRNTYFNGEYVEGKSLKDSTDIYGFTKALGDQALQDMKNTTVFRTSIIGEEDSNGKSFVEWILHSPGPTINGYTNHLWNGVTCLKLCEEMELLVGACISTEVPLNGTSDKGNVQNHLNQLVRLSNVIVLGSTYTPDGGDERSYITKAELVKCVIDVYGLGLKLVEVESAVPNYRDLYVGPYSCGDIRKQIKEMHAFNVLNRGK